MSKACSPVLAVILSISLCSSQARAFPAPGVGIESPGPRAIINGPTDVVVVAATTVAAISKVTVFAGDATGAYPVGTAIPPAPTFTFRGVVRWAPPANGQYLLYAVMTDVKGTTYQSSVVNPIYGVPPSPGRPEIAIAGPLPFSRVSGVVNVPVTGAAPGGVKLVELLVTMNGQTRVVASRAAGTLPSSPSLRFPMSLSWNAVFVPQGEAELQARVTDLRNVVVSSVRVRVLVELPRLLQLAFNEGLGLVCRDSNPSSGPRLDFRFSVFPPVWMPACSMGQHCLNAGSQFAVLFPTGQEGLQSEPEGVCLSEGEVTIEASLCPLQSSADGWQTVFCQEQTGASSSQTRTIYELSVNSTGALQLSYVPRERYRAAIDYSSYPSTIRPYTLVQLISAPGAVVANRWSRVHGVIDPSNNVVKIFVDGALVVSRVAPRNNDRTPGFIEGRWVGTPIPTAHVGRQLRGTLDNLCIYRRALTDAEVLRSAKRPAGSSL